MSPIGYVQPKSWPAPPVSHNAPNGQIASVALLLALTLLTPAYPQTQAIKPVQTEKKKPQETKANGDHRFMFITKSVEVDNGRYRVEGVTLNVWRFLIQCKASPSLAYKAASRAEMIQKLGEYDSETFRRVVLEQVGWASLNANRTMMTLYRNVVSTQDVTAAQRGEKTSEQVRALQERIRRPGGGLEPYADCFIVNRIENAEEMPTVTVVSSQFRKLKDGTGYEIEATTADEALTLLCAERKGSVCSSLAPRLYRATRSGSQMRLYDSDLNIVGIYRIVREGSP